MWTSPAILCHQGLGKLNPYKMSELFGVFSLETIKIKHSSAAGTQEPEDWFTQKSNRSSSDQQHCALSASRYAHSADGRYALALHGDLYNTDELRRALQDNASDSAGLALHALARWGRSALSRFNGAFALACYDAAEKRVLLARDHAGIKPHYYLHNEEGLLFSTRYDRLLSHPWARGLRFDPGAVALYLRFGYIPAPYALHDKIRALEPGSWLEADLSGGLKQGRYYDFPVFQEPDLHGEEAFAAVDAALTDAVKRRTAGEEPPGAFLSGGVDSPLITALAQSLSPTPLKTFSIGVAGSPLDESADAALYARALGVEHHLQMIHAGDVETLTQQVAAACGEPVGDYSIFPTLLAARNASQFVSSALSGDGGDELFWGYTGRMGGAIRQAHLFHAPFITRKIRWWLLRRPAEWNPRYFRSVGGWYLSRHEHNFEGWLKSFFPDISAFPAEYQQYDYSGVDEEVTAQWVRWNEFTGHMQNGLLKVERAAEPFGLDVHLPLLDRAVIETALRVDWRSCLDLESERGKLPLRSALGRRVAHQTVSKRGFGVPMDEWLRGPLKPLFSDLVLGQRDVLGLPINQPAMRAAWLEHQSGAFDRSWGLWIILSAALWQKEHGARA